MAMNQEIKEKWVAALRSGDYKQGKEMLRNAEENTYCCLGVLCDLAEKDGVAESRTIGRMAWYRTPAYGMDEDSALTPRGVAEWADLDDEDPFVGDSRVSSLNDSGVPFAKIADLIEQHL